MTVFHDTPADIHIASYQSASAISLAVYPPDRLRIARIVKISIFMRHYNYIL
jgi:hypothetical protein